MGKVWSVFTNDLKTDALGGKKYGIEVHHIYGGFARDASTKYGYCIPLFYKDHPNGSWAREHWVTECERLTQIDQMLKKMAQRHFEENHGSRAEFIRIFGRSYLED